MDQLDHNKTKLYGTIWGQCSPTFKSEIIGNEDYKEKIKEFDCIWLMKKPQKLCSGLYSNNNVYVATHSSLKSFYLL